VGGIVINARTLTTDQQFRNQALRGQILRSSDDKYEFITFTPTALSGLPETSVSIGDTVTFQMTGDLKIIEVTKSVTFEVTVTLDSATQISGSGKTTVLYKDFNITIPSVPGVANITDEVALEIDFVAAAVQ
jgi:polyisoprenoid-binding protein YceI